MATSRQIRAEQTRARLLEVGVGLIEERGYEAVSIKDIVAAAEVSIGTFYHYFDSKDAFYYTHLSRHFSQIDEGLAANMGLLSPIENLNRYVDSWFGEIERTSPDYLAHWLSHVADPAYHAAVGQGPDVSALHIRALEDCIAAYVERGVLDPGVRGDMVAETIMTLLYGIDVRYCMTGGELSLERWTQNIKSFIYKNIAPYMDHLPEHPGYDIDILEDYEFDAMTGRAPRGCLRSKDA